jgi:hypothetical protein
MIKRVFNSFSIGLLATLLSFSDGIEGRAISGALAGELSQAQSASARPIVQSTGAVVSGDTSEYVQSEAHMQLDAVKEKMSKFIMRVPEDPNKPERPLTPNQMVTPYLNLVAQVLNKEVEFKNSHYALYQATNNEWRVPQDLFKRLYIHYKKPGSQLNDFAFVRFSDCKSIKAKDYLQESVEKFGGVNDNIQEVREVMLSVNIALFGNAGFPGECTWNYFLEAKSHRWPMPQNYYEVLNAFDVTYDIEALAKETQALSEILVNASPEQTLLQFFIPQNKIDDVAYLAWLLGFPAHKKSVELMEKVLEGKPMVGAFTGPAVKGVMKKFKREESNPVYQELLQAAANGDFGVSGFLKALCTDPFAMENQNVNETQARLLVTKDVLQNPASGVKIFSYFTTPKNVQDAYLQKLDQLAAKIIAQESSKSAQQKVADKAKNEATFVRLKAEAEAKAAADKAANKAAKPQMKK